MLLKLPPKPSTLSCRTTLTSVVSCALSGALLVVLLPATCCQAHSCCHPALAMSFLSQSSSLFLGARLPQEGSQSSKVGLPEYSLLYVLPLHRLILFLPASMISGEQLEGLDRYAALESESRAMLRSGTERGGVAVVSTGSSKAWPWRIISW